MQLSNPVGWENSSAALPAYKTSKAALNMRKLAATPFNCAIHRHVSVCFYAVCIVMQAPQHCV